MDDAFFLSIWKLVRLLTRALFWEATQMRDHKTGVNTCPMQPLTHRVMRWAPTFLWGQKGVVWLQLCQPEQLWALGWCSSGKQRCLCKTPLDLDNFFKDFWWFYFLSWPLKAALESHLIILIKKQSIIVNKYFSLPHLEVFLPTLALPSGQEFHSCYAGDDMDCSLVLQGIKLAISKSKSL